ncbi:hypothetical protein Bca101_043716 [Brassica carinata]
MFGCYRRRRSHHHCLPPSRITITGGGACVIGAVVVWCFLHYVGVNYRIREMESMSRGVRAGAAMFLTTTVRRSVPP